MFLFNDFHRLVKHFWGPLVVFDIALDNFMQDTEGARLDFGLARVVSKRLLSLNSLTIRFASSASSAVLGRRRNAD